MTKRQITIPRFLGNSFVTAMVFACLISFVFIFSYQTAHTAAAQGSLTDPGGTLRDLESRGIVPCGTRTTTPTCDLCDIFKLAKNITDFFVYAGLMATAGFIGYGGFLILSGAYSEEKTRHGKEVLTAAITGLLILLLGWLIVDTAIKVMVGSSVLGSGADGSVGEFLIGELGPWNAINCAQLTF